MTLNEAAQRGISRVRLPQWADPLDYLRIDLVQGGQRGPWAHLYSPSQSRIGATTPQTFLCFNDANDRYEEYSGPLLEKVAVPDAGEREP